MTSVNFIENNIEFNFNIHTNDSEWYSQSKFKDYILEITAEQEIFENEQIQQKLQAFGKIISENIGEILEKTMKWTQNLYNELGSFEDEKGYFEKVVSIRLKDIEIGTFFEFKTNISFFSKIDLIMDINHFYYVQFKSIYDKVFVRGIIIE